MIDVAVKSRTFVSHDLSHQPKYNILELKLRGVIITIENTHDLYMVYRYKLL